MSTVEQQVKAIVAEQLGVKQEQVTNDASFVDDLGRGLAGHGRVGDGARRGVRDRDPGRGRREDHDRAPGDRLHQRAPDQGLIAHPRRAGRRSWRPAFKFQSPPQFTGSV